MESRLDAADRRIDNMLPPEQPDPAQPNGSQTFGSGDLVQHLPPSGNSKASLGPSGLVSYDSLAPLQQSSTTPLPFALLPDTALEPPYAASQNTRSELLPWQVEYRSSAYALSKTSDGDVLECNKKEILILNCDRVEEGFDDSSEKILHSSSRFCGVEKVDIDGNLEAHEDDVARELKSVEEKKSIFIIKDKFVHMCVEEDEATPDHGVLTPLKNWLKLLPDGSLPSINVCAAILRIFFDLPISLDQFGQREQLKKNDLGKDIMFLSKPDEMTRSNQKIAQDLVNKWSHLVFNKSPPSVYFYGNNEGRPSTIRYAFDPGGDSSPKFCSQLVPWFPP